MLQRKSNLRSASAFDCSSFYLLFESVAFWHISCIRSHTDPLNQLHLGLVQPGIGAFLAEQVGVLADFDDPAAFEHDQPIGFAQRAQAMGDRDRRAALNQIVERI